METALFFQKINSKIKRSWKLAFFTVLVVGLLAHLPVMVGDYPNHDGLSSMYFDQNMITSGRWFLTIACGFSSYFTLPWLIGVLSLVFLGIGAAALVTFLDLRESVDIILCCGMLVAFPALASTYAYLFTADGYMLALAFVFLAVALTKQFRLGFIPGAVLLALSMGTYQSYLAFAIILCVYGSIRLCLQEEMPLKEKGKGILHYAYMGIGGVALYYVVLRILLLAEGKVLDTYQGIDGMDGASSLGIMSMLNRAYHDFLAFAGKGNVLVNNTFSGTGMIILTVLSVIATIYALYKRGYLKKWTSYVLVLIVLLILPLGTNMILFISPDVTYHLLMRYQYVLYPILCYAFVREYIPETKERKVFALHLCAILAGGVLLFNFVVTDQIAYGNLQKKYEKTYAYCLRLADRMEQTPGYYTGMPVAMIGVQNKENLPDTDLTASVTSGMIGMNGDYLVYTDKNYQSFMKNYLGISITLVEDAKMEEIYLTKEYQELTSFPDAGCMKVVDGILYVKTE